MRILLMGGNGFIGRLVAAELIQQRHAVAVFHRGTTAAPAGVEELRGNRNQLTASAQQLKRFAPDVVIDLVFSSGPQAEELMNIRSKALQLLSAGGELDRKSTRLNSS